MSPFFADKKKILIFAAESAGVAQLVEHDLAKVGVAGSSPVSRSNKKGCVSSLFIFTKTDDMLAWRRDE